VLSSAPGMSKARLALSLFVLSAALAPPVAADPVAVRTTPVPLNPSDPRQKVVGRLEYRGGLHVVSDHPRFGGLSSIRVFPAASG